MRGAPDNDSSSAAGSDVAVAAALAVAAAASAVATAAMDDRKRSLRFTLATDIVLLQEVNRRKPWASPHGKIRETWEQIAAAVTAVINDERDPTEPPARVDHGSSKRRYDVLMEAFAKDELKSMRAKGSVELYVRREELLTDLSLQVRPACCRLAMVSLCRECPPVVSQMLTSGQWLNTAIYLSVCVDRDSSRSTTSRR